MKEKIKRISEKSKEFCKKHKKGIIFTLIGVIVSIFTGAIIKKRNDDECYECTDDFDPGRDCKMIFEVDDESKEVLGEIPCTESYAKDMIEVYSSPDDIEE